MPVSIGLVGLPNVGKSTLFNALVKTAQAEAANFPFCTIEPNTGVVAVPDDRLFKLAEIAKSAQIVPAVVTFIDIAGLVAGAHKGEGLGNAFLSHIRETSAIAQVVRVFTDPNVIHVAGSPNPKDDVLTVTTELLLADLATLEKAEGRAASAMKSGNKEEVARHAVYQKLLQAVSAEKPARSITLTPEEQPFRQELQLLTGKPVLYVLNTSDSNQSALEAVITEHNLASVGLAPDNSVLLSAKLEAEVATLPEAEQADYLSMFGQTEPGLNRLINKSYHLLGLQSFYTAGEKEARAWTTHQGATAVQAAGEIHTDFIKKFIKAEVASYADFVALGGWSAARLAGKVRLEGKDYLMQPDDVVYFKIGG